MTTSWKTLVASALIAIGATLPASAGEVEHYEAKPSETLEQAMENFVTYNRKMEEVLARDPLTPQDMEEVHQLTYTIEVALAKINEELGALPAVLEEVHLSSEGDNPARLKGTAEAYMEKAELLDR
mgnify:CR=1 FL=1